MNTQNPWENTQEVPQRFQAVASGEKNAGPHSVKAAHMASHSHRLQGEESGPQHGHEHLSGSNTKPTTGVTNTRKENQQMTQEFGEVSASGHAIDEETGATRIEEADVLEAMRDVIDPELGINIVDLGLVYGVNFADDGGIVLDMTLTSAACPLTDMLEQQTQMVLSTMASRVEINWVWMPPWGPDRITAEGREQLRALGFNV